MLLFACVMKMICLSETFVLLHYKFMLPTASDTTDRQQHGCAGRGFMTVKSSLLTFFPLSIFPPLPFPLQLTKQISALANKVYQPETRSLRKTMLCVQRMESRKKVLRQCKQTWLKACGGQVNIQRRNNRLLRAPVSKISFRSK